MKFAIPEISWHNRDPVLSVDFQPKSEGNGFLRLASGGTDSHVLIWYITTTESGSVNIEVAADLTRHQKAVNVVRWSPNGHLLASGDDESIIFIWQQKTEKETVQTIEQGEEQYKETWVIFKTLRGHMEDVLDLSWSADSLHIASGSVDNKLLVWDVPRGRYSSIINDHKGFVQGVAWDPQGSLIASTSTDRVFRTFDVTTKKVVSRSSKATLPFPADHPLHEVKVRLYHDDTLQTYYRRLQFSPDGLLIAVPAGKIEPEQGKLDTKPINAVYIYTRYSLKVPACVVPCGEAALVCRWSPRAYLPRGGGERAGAAGEGEAGAGEGAAGAGRRGLAAGRARHVLAVGTKRSVLVYDTQQPTPLAIINNMHYTRLTDLTWSPDGRTLLASSTDGFCSVITFSDGELGDPLPDAPPTLDDAVPMEVEEEPQKVDTTEAPKDTKPEVTKDKKQATKEKSPDETKPSNIQKIDSFIKFKSPSQKSPKKQKIEKNQKKTPIKIDVMEEVAMPSWSDNSNSDVIKHKGETMEVETNTPSEIIEIEDSEDMKLVYEESQSQSPAEEAAKPEAKVSPKEKKSPSETKKGRSNKSKNKTEGNNFFKQAKVTDMKEPVVTKAAPSPKAPRRVSFVTLSSPKNSKKK